MHLNDECLLERIDQIKRIFFWRICGTGMGAAAVLLKQSGLYIEGCDTRFYPPMGPYLIEQGIQCLPLGDVTDEYLKSFDLIVVGNVVPRGGEEALRIESLNIPYCSFPSVVGCFVLKDRNVIGIAGTHGKTTTTYFAAQMFEKLGEKPGYFIGGVLPGRPSSFLGDSKYFFIESDEYDSAYFQKHSKFLSYHLDSVILTSLEFDHADIFDSIDDIKAQFNNLMPTIDDKIIVCSDYEHGIDVVKDKDHIKYSTSLSTPKILEKTSTRTTFELNGNKFDTNVIGEHNILNLSSVILYALEKGFSPDAINSAIKEIEHVKRRQEFRGRYGSLYIVDDFAHHPKAVKYTIDAIKTQYQLPVTVLFEPVSATARSSYFQQEFEEALATADKLILAKPPRPTTVKSLETINVDTMAENLSSVGVETALSLNLDQLINIIDTYKNEESVLLVLSNGTCQGLWESDFVEVLEK